MKASENKPMMQPGRTKHMLPKEEKTYVVLHGSAGKSLGMVLVGSCPLVSIDVMDKVDVSTVKALNDDLYVNTFGYSPVTIQMSGLELHSCGRKNASGSGGGNDSIGKFFAENNVHKSPKARVDVVLRSASGSAQSYRCVVVSMKLAGEGKPNTVNTVGYELNLIGIRI